MFCSYVIVVIMWLMECRSEDALLPQILTTSYSQVSHSGSARSNAGAGQTPWTHRSDAHILRGQNLSNRKNPGRLSVGNKKHFEDSIGEVIQERFNPRPWFAYEAAGSKEPQSTYIPPPKPNMELSVPFDSFPLSLPTNNKEKPSPILKTPFNGNDKPQVPLNTYGSPYDSYNPKPSPATKSPSNFVTPNKEYLPPELENEKEMNEMKYQHETDQPPEDSDQNDHHSEPNDDMHLSPPSVPFKYSPDDHHSEANNGMHLSPPSVPFKYSPDDHHSEANNGMDLSPPSVPFKYSPDDHHSEANNDMHLSPPSVPFKYSPDDHDEIIDHPPAHHEHGYHHIVDQDGPEYPHVHGNSFDLYHNHDHPPIYYEIKTTTTEAPENQRLNKRPYSYYYIGRKLWYIPLYFSVYFIIYIFVLILKSIARHKITFNQYFEEDKREMKDMHEEHEAHIHEVEHHVFGDIMNAKRKYMM